MTDLSPLAILSGKSAGRLLAALLLILIQLPFTLLAITLGGVSIDQILAAYCTLGAYTCMLGAVALFCSVWRPRTAEASGFTLMIMLAFFVGPWLVHGIVKGLTGIGPGGAPPGSAVHAIHIANEWVIDASPIRRLFIICRTGFSEQVIGFQVVTNLAAAGVLFLLAWLTFERFSRNLTADAPARPRGLPRLRGRRKCRRPWRLALLWKDYMFMAGGHMAMVYKTIIYGACTAAIAYIFYFYGNFEWEAMGPVMLYVFMMVMVLELALLAGRVFREEIKYKTLAPLVMLPRPLYQVMYAKTAGCMLAIGPAAVFMMIGAAMNREFFFEEFLAGLWYEPIVVLAFVSAVLFYIHLVAYLSLWLKWGAFAAAFGIYFIGLFCFPIFGTLFMLFAIEDEIFSHILAAMFSLTLLSLCVLVHVHSHFRLLKLASQ